MNVLHFALSGLLGAVLYVLVWSKSWRDLVRYESFRHLAIGVLSGVFYFLLCSNHGFPDSVMAVVVGYFGPDFIQGIMDKLRALTKGGKEWKESCTPSRKR